MGKDFNVFLLVSTLYFNINLYRLMFINARNTDGERLPI